VIGDVRGRISESGAGFPICRPEPSETTSVLRYVSFYPRQEQPMADTDSNPAAAASERMRAAGSAMTGQGSQLGLAILSQAEANTQEAFRAMRAAAQANDVAEVMRIQSDYLRDQGARSMAQAREVSEMIAQFGRSAIGQMTGRG
jgi:hypothetical protein